MYIIVLLFSLLATVLSEPFQSTCCLPEQGILMDGEDFCENPITKTLMPLHLECETKSHVPSYFFNFNVKADGSLELGYENVTSENIEAGQFCVAERTVNETEGKLVICVQEAGPSLNHVLHYCMIVSVVFLTLTAIVYCILPEIRDLQGKSIINFSISLAIALILLMYVRLVQIDMETCGVRAFLTYFFLLVSFFWTNAISIQIFLGIRRPVVHDYSWKTFSYYALYAWGCPALLTMCIAIVNYHTDFHSKLGFGISVCWFSNTRHAWYYLYSIMATIIIVNTVIFIYTSANLWRQSFSSTHIKAIRYKALMTVKLCIIMGLPWIFEMISSLFEPHVIWTLLDIFNTLQGPLIFLVLVVLRRRVIKALYKKGLLGCISGVVERHLAVAEDDEDIVQHTTDIGLEDGNKI